MVERTDISLRLQDYKRSIEFYLKESDLPLFFLENSDFDLESDLDFKRFSESGRFFIHRLNPHPTTSNGKGFQEFYMLDQFFALPEITGITAKISGRYIIQNLKSLLRTDKPMHIDLHRKRLVAITGFFTVSREFYQNTLRGLYHQADDRVHRYIEHVLYDVLNQAPNHTSVGLLPHNARYQGISGSHGGSMHRNKYKMMIREVERQVLKTAGINKFLIEY